MIIEIGNIVGGFLAGAGGIRKLGLARSAEDAVVRGQAKLAPYTNIIARLLLLVGVLNFLSHWFFWYRFFYGSILQSLVAIALGLILDQSIFGGAAWAQNARKAMGGWETAIGVAGIIIGLAGLI